MFKVGDRIVYFGNLRKLYKRRGVIQDRFDSNRWRVQLDGGVIVFAADKDLAPLQQTFDDMGNPVNDRYLDDLM